MDIRPLELAVPSHWAKDPAFALCMGMFVPLNEVARATLEKIDGRSIPLANIVQYNLYRDGSFTPPALATTKNAERTQKAGWAFVIAAQYYPRAPDETIVGVAASPMVQSDMDHHGLTLQSAETSGAFVFHQAVKWAIIQACPVTIFFDCAGAGLPAAGLANPFVETKAIAQATRALVH